LLTEQGIDIALMPHEPGASGDEPFFGRPEVLAQDPVVAYIPMPTGGWKIAAVPRQGWHASPDNTWLLRSLMLVGGALVVIPIAYAGRLYAGRQRDYLALKRGAARTRRLSQRLELALDASHIGVWELDLVTNKLFWDDRLYDVYGIKKSQMPRTYEDWLKTLHPDDVARADDDFRRQVAEDRSHSSEYRIIWPDGSVHHIRTHATIVHHPHDHPRMIGAEWDVTDDVTLNKDLERAKNLSETRNAELAAAKARIEHNALHDSLTGLPNRRYLDEELERLAQKGRRIALLQIDLDRFKHINDTLGHAAGDAMLVHAAQVLRENARPGDFVARIGGDEFAVASLADEAALNEIAQSIVEQMRRPVAYRGHQCRFSVSIGIATEGGGAPIEPARLLINADIALYRAKNRGRNRLEFFTEVLQAEIIRNKKVADDILGGLERNEFIAYYQPQFDARTLEIAGVEALVRWAHPTEGLLRPIAFLAIAEELDVVATIDKLVLEQTLANFAHWNRNGTVVPRISVNVSARRLRDEELIESLKRYDIPSGTLSFELLESIFLDDTDDTVSKNVERIKELGIDIAIDDFGTGYASIVSLLNLKPRTLKIDRQLILPLVGSPRQRHLVESIVEMGKTLGIEVVAEGVETIAHARILKDIGCDKLQGDAFGQVLNAADLAAYIRSESWRAAS
jgi:diguanylate cyclase (GGDEF)-like protein